MSSNGWYRKKIGRKEVECRKVPVRSRSGRKIVRELCYELKPDGTRGRLVHSAVDEQATYGKPEYTLAELRQIERSRSKKSRARDEATTSETVISYKDPRVNRWAKDPEYRRRVDVRGVDTKGAMTKSRTPRKTPRTMRKGNIVCKTYTTRTGRTVTRCRNMKTGEFVSPRSL